MQTIIHELAQDASTCYINVSIDGATMKVDQAVKYFGTQRKVAEVLGLHEAAVSRWITRGNGIVPIKHIIALKDMSYGELDLVMDDYRE